MASSSLSPEAVHMASKESCPNEYECAELGKNCTSEQGKETKGKVIKITEPGVDIKSASHDVEDGSVVEDAKLGHKRSASNSNSPNQSSTCYSSAEEVPSTDAVDDSSKSYSSQIDSCERDISAESSAGSHGCVSSSNEEHERQAPPGQLKSVGSAGHPNQCTECTFYFFANQGCSKGSDCRFCHEFHPRKTLRKDRRFLKRIKEEDKKAGDTTTITTLDASGMSSSEDEGQPSTRVAGSMSTIPTSLPFSLGKPAVLAVRYLRRGLELGRLTFAVGQEVAMPATIKMQSSAREALQKMLIFSVDPPLQSGLSLDPQIGKITGMVTTPQARTEHVVTVSTQATGFGGVKLGLVPLARTSLHIRIIDLTTCKASCVWDGDERIFIEFKLPPRADGSKLTQPSNKRR